MSHLDEGTLHALLDGELDLTQVSEIQLHLGSCVACGSRLQEVKQVLAEADRLVGAVEVPAGAARPRPEPSRTASPAPAREPAFWDETPVLLVPDPIDAEARRKRWLRGLRWAAAILVVVGGGRILANALRPGHPMLPERDLTSASPAVPPAVVSPEERRKPEPALAKAREAKPGRTPALNRSVVPKTAPKDEPVAPEPAADSSSNFADAVTPSLEDSVAADSQFLAAQAAADTATELAVAPGAVADSAPPVQAREDAADQSQQEDELATRRAAAAALEELDRERRRERANAATAALPPARQAPTAMESAPAPRPPTLEQRAQIYLRIGLDEAAKQLGRPVHVIEGMTPQFIGLTRSQLVPGSEPRRPVVRVVYLDSRGRMILLDQQRMDPAPAASGAASGSLRWTLGNVMLYLRGEPSPDVLRSLQARVR